MTMTVEKQRNLDENQAIIEQSQAVSMLSESVQEGDLECLKIRLSTSSADTSLQVDDNGNITLHGNHTNEIRFNSTPESVNVLESLGDIPENQPISDKNWCIPIEQDDMYTIANIEFQPLVEIDSEGLIEPIYYEAPFSGDTTLQNLSNHTYLSDESDIDKVRFSVKDSNTIRINPTDLFLIDRMFRKLNDDKFLIDETSEKNLMKRWHTWLYFPISIGIVFCISAIFLFLTPYSMHAYVYLISMLLGIVFMSYGPEIEHQQIESSNEVYEASYHYNGKINKAENVFIVDDSGKIRPNRNVKYIDVKVSRNSNSVKLKSNNLQEDLELSDDNGMIDSSGIDFLMNIGIDRIEDDAHIKVKKSNVKINEYSIQFKPNLWITDLRSESQQI